MAIKPRILFLCTENSCRTQMAEGFLRELTGDEFEIVSAGAEPVRLDAEAVAAMREVGIDISSARTKIVDPYLRVRFHYVITLCDRRRSGHAPCFPARSGGRRGPFKAWR
jgi:arsenate reductase (thioredoxin)